MCTAYKQVLNLILPTGLHAFDAPTTATLAPERVWRHALHITSGGDADQHIFLRNQVFNAEVGIVITGGDGRASFITIILTNLDQVLAD